MRTPKSLLAGLMWFDPQTTENIRHNAQERDGDYHALDCNTLSARVYQCINHVLQNLSCVLLRIAQYERKSGSVHEGTKHAACGVYMLHALLNMLLSVLDTLSASLESPQYAMLQMLHAMSHMLLS